MALSKRNRRGLLWVVLLTVIIAISPRVISAFSLNEEPIISFQEMKQIHQDFVVSVKKEKTRKYKSFKSKFSVPNEKVNPNELSTQDWKELGLSQKQADIVVKFSKRGLRSNSDLKKIYVFPKELFNLIKDSLFYPKTESHAYNNSSEYDVEKAKKEYSQVLVDISIADQEELETIPGIGPFFAKKILDYRNSLGGFVSKSQLLEIWKFDEQKLNEIDEYLVLSKREIQKININSTELEELKNHPYISYSVANSIIKMRETNGKYSDVGEIKKSKLISEELYQKIVRYITVE